MVLRLDPSLPLVWRDPHSMQLGVDRAAVVLYDLSGAEERMLAALASGVSRAALGMVARASGAPAIAADRLLRRLGPTVLGGSASPEASSSPSPPTTPARVVVAGRGATAARLVDALQSSGLNIHAAGDDRGIAATPADLAIVVAQYVIAPDYYGLWLRRDQPHLPVVIGDAGARIGPIIEPGIGPCLHCLERFRTDADPAWPAIASQLWGRRSPHDTGLVAGETAGVAARMVLARLDRTRDPEADRHRSATAASVRIVAATGLRTTRAWSPHPECGCGALPGNGTAADVPTGSGRSPTTTGRAASAPA